MRVFSHARVALRCRALLRRLKTILISICCSNSEVQLRFLLTNPNVLSSLCSKGNGIYIFYFYRKRNDVFKCMNHDWLKVRWHKVLS